MGHLILLLHAQSTLAICYRVRIKRKQLATACAVYASNWLLHAHALYANNLLAYAQLTLANFYAQATLAIATIYAANASVCAMYARNLLPYVQCTLAKLITC
jgi:hypothetical protein